MPQQPLTEQAIENYILLEKTQRNLSQKIIRTQNNLLAAKQRGEKMTVEKINRELYFLKIQSQEITYALLAYTISIDHDLSVTAQDNCPHDFNLFPLQELEAEISRLRHRCSSLRIYASREEAPTENLHSRLHTMTQAIRKLQTRIPQLEIETKPLSSVTQYSDVTSMFKSEQKRDLRSSADMRATLRQP